ncbi:MAG: OmpA family protein [Bdellovibrio bacteriovorus]
MSDTTPESRPEAEPELEPDTTSTGTIYKTLTWMLVVALIGLYALYNWYDGRLKQGLVGKDAEMAEVAEQLTSAEARLRTAGETEAELRSEIARIQSEAQAAAAAASGALQGARQELQAQEARAQASAQELASRQSEIERLTGELSKAGELEQQLRGEIKTEGEAHAAELQRLQSQIEAEAQSAAAQQEALDAAGERAQALESEIAGLKQALAEAQAKAEAEAADLKAGLEERIDFYRTALEGGEPERAAQIARLEAQAQTEHTALERAELALRDREAELGGRLEEALRVAETQTQALEAAQQSHATELSEARGKIFALDEELKSARAELAGLQEKLELTVADLGAKLEQGETALAAAKSELEAATGAAAQERQDLEGQIQEAEVRIAALEERLAQERAAAEQTLAEQQRQSDAALAEQRRQSDAALAAEAERVRQVLAEMRGLYGRFAELAARRTDRGMLLKLAEEDLRFQSGMAVLPRGELPSLDRIAELLTQHPGLSALIEGHTDSAGPDEINLELSKARAEAVRQALIERGVPAERLTAEGAGESRPIAENSTAAGRRQNRRVEVYVIEPSR